MGAVVVSSNLVENSWLFQAGVGREMIDDEWEVDDGDLRSVYVKFGSLKGCILAKNFKNLRRAERSVTTSFDRKLT